MEHMIGIILVGAFITIGLSALTGLALSFCFISKSADGLTQKIMLQKRIDEALK